MAYRIEPGEPISSEVRRVIVEQLRAAAGDLVRPDAEVDADREGDGAGSAARGPDDDTIHSARKHIKKARSAIRLARADLGRAVVRHSQEELRDLSMRLSAQRDADSQVEVADHLTTRAEPRAPSEAVAELHDLLVAEAERLRAEGSLTWGGARTVARRLEDMARWIEQSASRAQGWDGIEPGLRRQYRRGRSAFRALFDEPTIEELHDWRKRVKDLWYHERLLRRAWPKGTKPWLQGAEELAGDLGTLHDLGLLQDRLEGDDLGPLAELGADVRSTLLALVRDDACASNGLPAGRARRLMAERPAAFAARHAELWLVVEREVAADAEGASDGAIDVGAVSVPG